MELKLTRIDPSLPLPAYQTAGSCAFDLYTRIDADIAPGEIVRLPANIIAKVPTGYALLVLPRSSMPKRGLAFPHAVGLIDQDYCGPNDEILLQVQNTTNSPVSVSRGDRLAQGLLVPCGVANIIETKNMQSKDRGGFGSSGEQ